MKNLITIILTILVVNTIDAQTLSYKEFTKEDKGSDYKQYFSKDSTAFEVGEYIKIGNPSSASYKYIGIFQGLGYLPMSITENHLLDEECKIVTISVQGSRRKGYTSYIQVNNKEGDFFSIDIEKAIEYGEVNTKISENEILELLKTEKEKLDLGIISKEEFEKRRMELINKIEN